ncbi:hypothetical protein Lal_00001548 [Lupinus albus]|nr:hypothetical protein Lal_00001548 [Lupinus albus]
MPNSAASERCNGSPPAGPLRIILTRRFTQNKKALTFRLPILPGRFQPSTFGVYGLNYRVRDGNGWIPIAIATEFLTGLIKSSPRPISTSQLKWLPILHTWPIYLVVYKGLTSFRCERPHLKAGFTLRCFQRLSFPNVATQLYSWRNNWYTIGSSTPVLSY